MRAFLPVRLLVIFGNRLCIKLKVTRKTIGAGNLADIREMACDAFFHARKINSSHRANLIHVSMAFGAIDGVMALVIEVGLRIIRPFHFLRRLWGETVMAFKATFVRRFVIDRRGMA